MEHFQTHVIISLALLKCTGMEVGVSHPRHKVLKQRSNDSLRVAVMSLFRNENVKFVFVSTQTLRVNV